MSSVKVDKLKVITHTAALLPLTRLIRDLFAGGLGVDPIREIQLRTGKDAFILLVLTLSITPLNAYFGLSHLVRLRRILGVYAFVYATIHFLNFVGLDFRFDPELIIEGIFEKYFAVFGFIAYLILIPLVVTSTNGWKRRLGKRWKTLHSGFYIAAVFVVLHYILAAKSDFGEPLVYAAIIFILLLVRLRPAGSKPKTAELNDF